MIITHKGDKRKTGKSFILLLQLFLMAFCKSTELLANECFTNVNDTMIIIIFK